MAFFEGTKDYVIKEKRIKLQISKIGNPLVPMNQQKVL